MSRMKKQFLLSLLILLYVQSFGQLATSKNPGLENILPPSPNASAITKFGNIPVGLSTGIPAISVPVYNFENKSNGLNLPISLDYHAGGIKVSEVASNVGLGWALNAGGVVTRSVRGIPDELPDIGFINQPGLPQSEITGNSPGDIEFRPFNKINRSALDGQNDIFSFNFNGRSGKFMFGKNNDFLMINMQKLKVEKEIGDESGTQMIKKFIITDERGYQYHFDAYEVTTNHSIRMLTGGTFTSAWYLTKVFTPSKADSIMFTYENTFISYHVARGESNIVGIAGRAGTQSSSNTIHHIKGKRLKTIIFPDGVIMNCSYDTQPRTDLNIDYLLKKIMISCNGAARGVKLEHDYSLNRATLKKVVPVGGILEVPDSAYRFEYDIALPDSMSSKQDHWGFYNANTAGLIPREIFPSPIGGFNELPGGNRDTDPDRVKAGSLKKITYPTGGYTVFDMEANQAKDNWLDQKFTRTVTWETTYTTKNASEHLVSGSPHGSCFVYVPFTGSLNTTTQFTITAPNSASTCNGGCTLEAEIYNASGALLATRSASYGSSSDATIIFDMPNLQHEEYKIVLYTTGVANYDGYVNVSWRETNLGGSNQVTYEHFQPYVGGLRVKRIADYVPGTLNPASERTYEYVMEDGSSSGKLGVYPEYSYPIYYHYRVPPEGTDMETYIPSAANYVLRNSSPIYDLAYANGSPVTYKRVIEKHTNGTVYNGRIERFFSDFSVVLHPGFPYVPSDYKDWQYGHVLKELTYDKDSVLLSKRENEYKYTEDKYHQTPSRLENFRSVSIAPVKYIYYHPDGLYADQYFWQYISNEPYYFLFENFYPAAGRADLIKSKNFFYDKDGNILSEETDYVYDSLYYYLKKEARKSSVGDSIIKRINYPRDIVAAGLDLSGIYQGMITRNITDIPIEEINYKNQVQVLKSKTNHYNPFPNVFVPQSIDIKNGASDPYTSVKFDSYDSGARILSLTKSAGPVLSYKWAYNKQYPVAECTNALTEEFLSEDFEESGIAGNAHTGKKYYSGNYTTTDKLSPGLNGKSYLISYWSYSSGKWSYSGELAYTGQVLSGLIDDVRIFPVGSQMVTCTYDPLYGVTSTINSNAQTSFYEYDLFGRLKLIRDHNGYVLKYFDYRHQSPIAQ